MPGLLKWGMALGASAPAGEYIVFSCMKSNFKTPSRGLGTFVGKKERVHVLLPS